MTRIALLSFAHYHANFWAESFQAQEATTLAAIWDDDPERGRQAAGRFGVPFVADLDAAIAEADAVAICSETSKHADLVERAAAAGKAILCEKPIATDMAGADRIATAVAAHGVTYMQSFPKRHDPVSHAVREIIASGVLGTIHLTRIRHGHYYGLDEDFRRKWYVDPVLGGGGALLDEGVHGADFLCWLFGLPESVVATTSSKALGLAVEDSATAVYAYADGMTAEIVSSMMFTAADTSIEIYGTGGTVLVSGIDLASRDITPSGFLRSYVETGGERIWRDHHVTPQFKIGEFHQQNAIAFGRCLADGTPPPAGVDDGRNALLMIMKAYEAARTGVRQVIA